MTQIIRLWSTSFRARTCPVRLKLLSGCSLCRIPKVNFCSFFYFGWYFPLILIQISNVWSYHQRVHPQLPLQEQDIASLPLVPPHLWPCCSTKWLQLLNDCSPKLPLHMTKWVQLSLLLLVFLSLMCWYLFCWAFTLLITWALPLSSPCLPADTHMFVIDVHKISRTQK